MDRGVIGMILGHRGSPHELPENTMASFRRAMEAGAEGVELDVRTSADGVAVVIHDETVDRTTDGTGRVAEMTREELSRLRVRPVADRDPDADSDPPDNGERIPLLDDVVRWAARNGAFLNIELKEPGAEAAAVQAVRSAAILGRVIFSSFIPAVVAELGRIEPGARRYLLTEHWDAIAKSALRGCGAEGLCLANGAATAHVLAELAREGYPVVIWTVDDAARSTTLLDAGVVAVITNEPAAAVAARASRVAGRDAQP